MPQALSDLDQWLMGYDPILYSLPHKMAGIYEGASRRKMTANQKRLLGASSIASDAMYLHLAGDIAVAGFEGVLPSAWSQMTIWRYARTLRFYTPHTITAYVVVEALQNWDRDPNLAADRRARWAASAAVFD